MSDVSMKAVPLPATVEDMLSRREHAANRTLNDYVDDIHKTLWGQNSPEYRALLDAVDDADAVEGSLAIDNAKAAELIRAHARKMDMGYVAGKKLASIVRSLNVVLRRYKMTRKERAIRLGGKEYAEAT